MKFTPSLLAFALSTGAASAQMGLFERSLDNHIKTLCGIDIISPTPPPTKSPSSAPSAAPSESASPTILVKECGEKVGNGECLDKEGRKFDYCHSDPLAYTAKKCRALAESIDETVGWQFGPLGVTLFVCTLYYDNTFSGNKVSGFCPDDFAALTVRSGTGFPVSGGNGISMCFACNKVSY